MDAAIEEDVAKVNSELLLQASDPDEGESILRLLGAQPNVIARIASAGPKGVGTARDLCPEAGRVAGSACCGRA